MLHTMDQAIMFADSVHIRIAANALKHLSGKKRLEEYHQKGLKVAGRYLKAVGITKPPSKPITGEFATRAIEGRPLWYYILAHSSSHFRDTGIAIDDTKPFLKRLEKFLLSAGKAPILKSKEFQLGTLLLDRLADSLLLTAHPLRG